MTYVGCCKKVTKTGKGCRCNPSRGKTVRR